MIQAAVRSPRSGRGFDAEHCGKSRNPPRSDEERAAVQDMLDLVMLESVAEGGGADGAGQMRPALAPVETGATEYTALGAQAKIDAELIEE